MKKLIDSFSNKQNTIKDIIIQYEMFNTNCTYEHAERKSEIFLQFKKQGVSETSKECIQ